MNKVKQGANRGFTIVELLIVIVVIGILAAITIVAYTGITSQANAKTTLGNAQSVKSVVDTYYGEKGSYPAVGGTAAATVTNINAGTYAQLPGSVTIVIAGPITGNNTQVLYAVNAGGTGACYGYMPANSSTFAFITSGSATSLTNVATPVCT